LKFSGLLDTFYQKENSVCSLLYYGLIIGNQVLSQFQLLRHNNNNKNNSIYSNKIIFLQYKKLKFRSGIVTGFCVVTP